MSYNYQPIKKLAANAVFNTTGLGGVNPNDPSNAYRIWNNAIPNTAVLLDNTKGRVVLTQFNQKAQFNTEGGPGVSPNDATAEYGSVLRQSS